MVLSLERLLLLAAPLFAAVAASKKKRATKSAKTNRRAKPARSGFKSKRATKPARRGASSASKRPLRSKPGAARGRHAPPPKPPQKPATKAVTPPKPVEPPPKPVQPVGRPILLSPEQGKYADSVNPRFRWLSVGGATRYEVNWSQDPNLVSPYTVISIATEAGVPVEKALTVGVTYYWRARGGNEAGWGPWSNIGSFGVLEETV
jgi:hypothetical protein